MKTRTLILGLLITGNLLFAQSSSIDWFSRMECSSEITGTSITTDENFVYTAGMFSGTCYLADSVFVSKGSYDFYISKSDKEGNHIWAQHFGGSDYDRCIDIIYHKGHLYATGFFGQTLYFADTMLISTGSQDMFLLDMDLNGSINWMRKIGGTGRDQGFALCTDNDDNLYVTGIFQDTVAIDDLEIVSHGDFDILTAKLDTDGEVLWINTAGGPGEDLGMTIANDKYNNIYVSGRFNDVAEFADTTVIALGYPNMFLVKYNSFGEQIWLQTSGGVAAAQGSSSVVDVNDHLFLSGVFTGTAIFGNDTLVANGYSSDIFLGAYDLNGGIIWLKSFGSNEVDYSNALAFDDDYLYFSCRFGDEVHLPDTTISNLSAQILQFTKSGDIIDIIQVGTYRSNHISLDHSSALYVTGQIEYGAEQLFGDSLVSPSYNSGDVYITKISYFHTGIGELFIPETILIYPNPANHLVNIIFDQNAVVTLYNLSGQIMHRQILQKESGSAMIDVFNFSPGMYIIAVQSERTFISSKLIIQ
jgi:hypothetical protein